MMAEGKIIPGSPEEKNDLVEAPGEEAKIEHKIYEESGSKEKEMTAVKFVIEYSRKESIEPIFDKIVEVFKDAYVDGKDVELDETTKSELVKMLENAKSDYNNWLLGHAYEPASPEDFSELAKAFEEQAYVAVGNKLRESGQEEGLVSAWMSKMKNEGYWEKIAPKE